MCGICGIYNQDGNPVSLDVLKKMTDVIAHRGPDGEGQFVDRFIGLGHRRLAIIDLSEKGHQPMTSLNGRFVISYNGEVYNFKEVRRELEANGYCFISQTDTEVILNAYALWGVACISRFNGMFAFAIWDRKKETLFLGRDRYGIKPLYFIQKQGVFLFASEIKAILQHPFCYTELDKKALMEYFTFQNFFTDRTLFKHVRILPAGHYLLISSRDQHGVSPIKYWDFKFVEPESPCEEQEYLEELDRLFHQAVKRQLVSDVEVGAYLSGGLDSGSITSVASSYLPYIKSFTCGFDLHSASGLEMGFDEREKAEHMSYLFKTEHYEMVLKAGDMERCLSQLTRHLEEPRVGQSYPNFYISRLASKFVKVVLSGTGGDELFGGYPWRYYRAVVNTDFENYIDKYYLYWQRLISNKEINNIFSPIWKDVKDVWTRDIFRDVFQDHAEQLTRPEDYINHSLYFEAKTFLHGLLVVEDKLSMAHGLESRVPFLDNDLVDFSLKLPVGLKCGNLSQVVRINENDPGPKTFRYFEKTRDGKTLLRKMLKKYVPLEITRDIKQGFSAPDASWFKGDSLEYVKSIIFNDQSLIYESFDKKSIREMVDEHLTGKRNRRLFIWSLLNFEYWCREYL